MFGSSAGRKWRLGFEWMRTPVEHEAETNRKAAVRTALLQKERERAGFGKWRGSWSRVLTAVRRRSINTGGNRAATVLLPAVRRRRCALIYSILYIHHTVDRMYICIYSRPTKLTRKNKHFYIHLHRRCHPARLAEEQRQQQQQSPSHHTVSSKRKT